MKGAFVLAEERFDNVGYRTFRHANPCNTDVRLLSLPSTENPYHRMLKNPPETARATHPLAKCREVERSGDES